MTKPWTPDRKLFEKPPPRVMQYLQPPDLRRVHLPTPGCTLYENEERARVEDVAPPARIGKPFEYFGAWCIDVPDGAISLANSARALFEAMPNEPRQKVFLLSSSTDSMKFVRELESPELAHCDIGEREAMLTALRDGRERAKNYGKPSKK